MDNSNDFYTKLNSSIDRVILTSGEQYVYQISKLYLLASLYEVTYNNYLPVITDDHTGNRMLSVLHELIESKVQ